MKSDKSKGTKRKVSVKKFFAPVLKPFRFLKKHITPKRVLIFLLVIILALALVLLFSYIKAHMKGTVSSACWIKSDLTVGGPSASDLEVDLDPNMIPIKQGASTLEC
ncbi:MAG: hypothetical protein LBL08_02985, partial [Candidatus Nomurabacteria bacterium]|nr:hypothetical protein [Candidatus Nomurabacteria bacterium]